MKKIGLIVGIVLLLVPWTVLQGATLSVPTDSHPSIQSALEAALDGDVVVIQPGVYEEDIDFPLDKAITMTGLDPKNPEIVASTIVEGVEFHNWDAYDGKNAASYEGESTVLQGLTISWVDCIAFSPTIQNNIIRKGGIGCSEASPVIQNNLITDNSGIRCSAHPDPAKRQGCSPLIRGNLITHNGTGISSEFYALPLIINNTFYGNRQGLSTSYGGKVTVRNCIFWDENPPEGVFATVADTSHCCIKDVWLNETKCFFAWDPLFVDPENGDFHLKSRAGRWDPKANDGQGGWVKDDVHSPCIDVGSPTADFSNEPLPCGGRVNLGAYGNTSFASKSCQIPTQIRRVSITGLGNFKFEWWARKDEVYQLYCSSDLANWVNQTLNTITDPFTVDKDGPFVCYGDKPNQYPYPKRRFYRLQIEPR